MPFLSTSHVTRTEKCGNAGETRTEILQDTRDNTATTNTPPDYQQHASHNTQHTTHNTQTARNTEHRTQNAAHTAQNTQHRLSNALHTTTRIQQTSRSAIVLHQQFTTPFLVVAHTTPWNTERGTQNAGLMLAAMVRKSMWQGGGPLHADNTHPTVPWPCLFNNSHFNVLWSCIQLHGTQHMEHRMQDSCLLQW